jgi:hypothetical protein
MKHGPSWERATISVVTDFNNFGVVKISRETWRHVFSAFLLLYFLGKDFANVVG